jgi:pimeloyl-ACP methyl ester carboxylesterase
LYYRDYPAPEHEQRLPILCLHGLTRNCRDFENFAAWQAGQRRLLAPDVRGRGRSENDPDWRRYRPDVYLEDIWALLDQAQLDSTIVLGTSMGGLLAMLMAKARPQAVAAVILNDVGPKVAPAGLLRVAATVGKLAPVASWAEAVRQTRTVNEAAFPDLDDNAWQVITRRGWRQSGQEIVPAFDPGIFRAAKAGLALPRDKPWKLYRALENVPTLLLRGELSDMLSVGIMRKMKQIKPDLLSATIPGRGHTPLLNEAAAIRAITDFLAGIRGP